MTFGIALRQLVALLCLGLVTQKEADPRRPGGNPMGWTVVGGNTLSLRSPPPKTDTTPLPEDWITKLERTLPAEDWITKLPDNLLTDARAARTRLAPEGEKEMGRLRCYLKCMLDPEDQPRIHWTRGGNHTRHTGFFDNPDFSAGLPSRCSLEGKSGLRSEHAPLGVLIKRLAGKDSHQKRASALEAARQAQILIESFHNEALRPFLASEGIPVQSSPSEPGHTNANVRPQQPEVTQKEADPRPLEKLAEEMVAEAQRSAATPTEPLPRPLYSSSAHA
jgi:hypothetical protein